MKLPNLRSSCTSIANSLGLDSREIRRKLADIIFIYDFANYNIDFPKLLFQFGFHFIFLDHHNYFLFINIKLIQRLELFQTLFLANTYG